jgi:hypothetical protein
VADLPKVEIPLEPVVQKRYWHLKSYFDEFVDEVNKSGINQADYVVQVVVVKKGGEVAPDKSAFE